MKPTIESIGIQIVDHCNLNCRGCLHFCHKGQEPYFYLAQQYQKDLKRLHEIVNINTIRIYGGEPYCIHNFVIFYVSQGRNSNQLIFTY